MSHRLEHTGGADRWRRRPGAPRSSGILSRLFGYVGGAFVCAGLAIYIGMRWDHLGATGRVLLTLGPGFCTFVLALVCTTDEAFAEAATPPTACSS